MEKFVIALLPLVLAGLMGMWLDMKKRIDVPPVYFVLGVVGTVGSFWMRAHLGN